MLWWTSWIMKAEPFAYAQLELRHDDFWSMTPAEYNDVRDGYYQRRRAQLEDMAHFVCTLINNFPMRGKTAKTIRMENILGPSPEVLMQLEKERKAKRKRAKE